MTSSDLFGATGLCMGLKEAWQLDINYPGSSKAGSSAPPAVVDVGCPTFGHGSVRRSQAR